jgi:hypothetical protein
MTNDTRPPVAPIEGHYAFMRDGSVAGPIRNASLWYSTSTDKWGCWHTEFLWDDTGRLVGKAYDPDCDIIATMSPDVMAVAFDLPEKFFVAKQMVVYTENERLRALISLADAVLDHADAHCRAFPIATAPDTGSFQVWDSQEDEWQPVTLYGDGTKWGYWITHWRSAPPPPTTPPLPAVFVELGQALEKIKGAQSTIEITGNTYRKHEDK